MDALNASSANNLILFTVMICRMLLMAVLVLRRFTIIRLQKLHRLLHGITSCEVVFKIELTDRLILL